MAADSEVISAIVDVDINVRCASLPFLVMAPVSSTDSSPSYSILKLLPQ